MTCPNCRTSDDVQRTLTRCKAGYVAAIICTQCNRQVAVTYDDPSEAIDMADEQFTEGGKASVK